MEQITMQAKIIFSNGIRTSVKMTEEERGLLIIKVEERLNLIGLKGVSLLDKEFKEPIPVRFHFEDEPEPERIMHAAIIRSDDHMLLGKSHSDIIVRSPYGTCKAESRPGFLTNTGRFVDSYEAAPIAFNAKQVNTDTGVLFSDQFWSKHADGMYDYDAEHGYVLKVEGVKP